MQSMRFVILVTVLLVSIQAGAQPPGDCAVGAQFVKRGLYHDSINPLSRCLSADLTDEVRAYILGARAYAYGEVSQFEQAMEDQRAFIALQKPQDARPLIMLGMYYRELKQYDKSLEALKTANEYGSGMGIYYHTGLTLHQAGRYKEAIEAYTKGIPKQPNYAYVFYRRALSYEAVEDRDRARRDFSRAFELVPKDGYEAEIAAKLNEYGFSPKVKSQ